MSRAFEISRESRPARQPGGRLDGDHRRHGRLAVPDGHGDPRRCHAAGGRAHPDLGSAAPARDPHGVAGRHVQRTGLRDRGSWRRHRSPALRAQRDPRRRLGGPVRRHRRPHGLLPAHARAVPGALQRPPRHLRGPAVGRHRGPQGGGSAGRDGHPARGTRHRRRRGGRRRGPRRPRRRRHARRRHRLPDARSSSACARRTACTASSGATTSAAWSA